MINKDITIYDIAKESNVSPATVSRVLTDNAQVKADKKERVLEIIKRRNFKPKILRIFQQELLLEKRQIL